MKHTLGEGIRSQFMLEDNISSNQGSSFVCARPIFKEYVKNLERILSFPDKFIHEGHGPNDDLQEALEIISSIVNTDASNLALIDTATTGINMILRSYKWKEGDAIVISDVAYGPVKSTMEFMKDFYGVNIIEVSLGPENIDADSIVSKFKQAFMNESNIKVCLFDFVSSMPSLPFPVKTLTELCREDGIISIVDAAHGIGLQPLDISFLQPDYLVSNLHKWYHVPPGCTLMYVAPLNHGTIQPVPIGSDYIRDKTSGTLFQKFKFLGSKNYGSVKCISTARQFREDAGGDEAIWNYCGGLRDKVLAEVFTGWELMGEPTLIANLKIPFKVDSVNLNSTHIARDYYVTILKYHQVEYIRIGFQMFNVESDYVRIKESIEKWRI